jgi:hypothetical protein
MVKSLKRGMNLYCKISFTIAPMPMLFSGFTLQIERKKGKVKTNISVPIQVLDNIGHTQNRKKNIIC